jgi:hAT family C-terminal dimerisation region
MDMLDAEDNLQKFIEEYDLGDGVIAQWRLLRVNCGRLRSTTIAATYLTVPHEHKALRTAYQILLTLPVTSAGVERSFSKLSFIKSKLRTTMGQYNTDFSR